MMTAKSSYTTVSRENKEKDKEHVDVSLTRRPPLNRALDDHSRNSLTVFITAIEERYFQFDFINCHSVVEFEERQSKLLHALSEKNSLCAQTSDALRRSMLDHTMNKLIRAYDKSTKKKGGGQKRRAGRTTTPATIVALIGAAEMQSRKAVAAAEARDVMVRTCRWLANLWQVRACTLYVYNRNRSKLSEFANGRLHLLDMALLLALAAEMRQEFDALVSNGSLSESTLFTPFAQVLLMQVNARVFPSPPPYQNAAIPCEVTGVERFIDHLSYFCLQMNNGNGEPSLGGSNVVATRMRFVALWRLYWFSVYEAAGYPLPDNPAYSGLFDARWVLHDGACAARALARLYQYVRNVVHHHMWLQDHMILQTWCDRIANLQTGLSTARFWIGNFERTGVLEGGEAALRSARQAAARWSEDEQRGNDLIKWISQTHGEQVVNRLVEIAAESLPTTATTAPSSSLSSTELSSSSTTTIVAD